MPEDDIGMDPWDILIVFRVDDADIVKGFLSNGDSRLCLPRVIQLVTVTNEGCQFVFGGPFTFDKSIEKRQHLGKMFRRPYTLQSKAPRPPLEPQVPCQRIVSVVTD